MDVQFYMHVIKGCYIPLMWVFTRIEIYYTMHHAHYLQGSDDCHEKRTVRPDDVYAPIKVRLHLHRAHSGKAGAL